jgi:solute carrier family 25 carnitine/acylcarnitine transporter 20/29
LAYLSQLLPSHTPDPLPSNLTTAPHLTVFAPSNDAIQQAFDDVEKRYLESDYGVEAIGRIMAGGVIVGVGKREKVGWKDTWGERALAGM